RTAGPLDVRSDFPITGGGRTFLNSAYIAPIPRPVVAAIRDFAEAKATRQLEVGELLRKTEEVRGQFARLINATADEVGLLFSTAEGENVLANGLDLKAGDNVVIDDLHYDTEFVLYRELERTRGIELRVARSRGGAAGVAEFEPLVDRRTRLVSVAWVSHRNGFRHDMRALADLAHAHGALIYADAIQAVGTLAVDVQAADVDALCAASYKWMLAGWGVAPFYVRRSVIDRIRLDRFGEMHVKTARPDGGFDLDPTARRFDYSSRAFGEAYALSAALTYLEQVGIDRIEAHTVGLGLKLQSGLEAQGHRLATPPGNRSPIVAVELARPVDEARAAFKAAKMDVTVRGGRVRLSPALFNSEDDVGRCLEVMKGLI
ncbi:MAG: aminotransferase class V-fold PLP-dependent enzyme, partial [Phenylobacterium sp.]|nr:aminotransferase class V-fold PLP-dependent enzyme [Phenylobacterium sp.]